MKAALLVSIQPHSTGHFNRLVVWLPWRKRGGLKKLVRIIIIEGGVKFCWFNDDHEVSFS